MQGAESERVRSDTTYQAGSTNNRGTDISITPWTNRRTRIVFAREDGSHHITTIGDYHGLPIHQQEDPDIQKDSDITELKQPSIGSVPSEGSPRGPKTFRRGRR